MLEEFKNAVELYRKFSDEEAAVKYVEQHRWNGLPTCPWCSSSQYYRLKSKTQPYYCKVCRRNYSVRSGTIFSSSNLPLGKWLIALWHVTSSKNFVGVQELSKTIGVTDKTAWFMLQRIRSTYADNSVTKLDGEVQVDEIYLGPDKKKMSKERKRKAIKGSGCVGKIPVVGIYHSPTGRLRYIVAENGVGEDLTSSLLDKYVSKDAVLVTDASRVYISAGKKQAKHVSLNHKRRQFGEDGYHSNGIEGSFRHFRDKMRSRHKGRVSAWHLQRYADEFTYLTNKSKEIAHAKASRKNGQAVEEPNLVIPHHLERVLSYKDILRAKQECKVKKIE